MIKMTFSSLRTAVSRSIRRTFAFFKADHLFELWRIKRHEKENLSKISDFYSGFIVKGMKVIDIGANVGNYSKVFLDLGASVIGVEPQTFCQRILKRRFRSAPRFKLVAAASGAQIAVKEIYKTRSHTIASMNQGWIDRVKNSNRFEGEDWNETENIQVTTLDRIIEQNFLPDYIKIDVEGFEPEVLKGLSYPVKYISFEITLPETADLAKKCIDQISSIGNYSFIIPEGRLTLETKWLTKSEIESRIDQLSSGTEQVSADIFCRSNG